MLHIAVGQKFTLALAPHKHRSSYATLIKSARHGPPYTFLSFS